MLTFKREDARSKLIQQTGTSPVAPVAFFAFRDPEENVRQEILN
jgi:hypothetical protein